MAKPTKQELIEKIVSEVDDYDIETLIDVCKDFWRDVLNKRTTAQLTKQLAERERDQS